MHAGTSPVTAKAFSIGEAVRFGWRTTWGNLWLWLGILAIVFAIESVPDIVSAALGENALLLQGLIGLLFFILSMVVQLGLIRVALQFVSGRKPRVADLFSESRHLLRYLGATILYALIFFGGLFLLIVPGVIWAIMFQFAPYLIIDRGLGPIAALKKSAELTRGARWNLFVFGLVLMGINLAGMLALLVGMLVTIPLALLATGYVYRTLLARAEGSTGDASPAPAGVSISGAPPAQPPG